MGNLSRLVYDPAKLDHSFRLWSIVTPDGRAHLMRISKAGKLSNPSWTCIDYRYEISVGPPRLFWHDARNAREVYPEEFVQWSARQARKASKQASASGGDASSMDDEEDGGRREEMDGAVENRGSSDMADHTSDDADGNGNEGDSPEDSHNNNNNNNNGDVDADDDDDADEMNVIDPETPTAYRTPAPKRRNSLPRSSSVSSPLRSVGSSGQKQRRSQSSSVAMTSASADHPLLEISEDAIMARIREKRKAGKGHPGALRWRRWRQPSVVGATTAAGAGEISAGCCSKSDDDAACFGSEGQGGLLKFASDMRLLGGHMHGNGNNLVTSACWLPAAASGYVSSNYDSSSSSSSTTTSEEMFVLAQDLVTLAETNSRRLVL